MVRKTDAAAAQPGGRRHGHGEREIGCDRRIGGAAAGAQHIAADGGRARLVGDDGAGKALDRADHPRRARGVAARRKQAGGPHDALKGPARRPS
jgi:hypothetical protein